MLLIAALFTIVKIGKQPKHSSTDGWIKKTHTHTGILLSYIKRKK